MLSCDHARVDGLLTVHEIAELLKLNPQTVRNWIDQGRLPAIRVGERRVRVRRSDLDAYLAARVTGVSRRQDADTGGSRPNRPAAVMNLEARDRFLGALTEMLRAAADETSRDRASALRALAAAAEASADALEGEAVDDDRR